MTEYLAGMYDKAQNLVNQRAYQYGGQVGGFDDRSTKLFDSAVKRSASTDPKSPELQRYLDNVIETRGKPTMVFMALLILCRDIRKVVLSHQKMITLTGQVELPYQILLIN